MHTVNRSFLSFTSVIATVVFVAVAAVIPATVRAQEVSTATMIATKIVCNSEADLPNWGNGADDITADTAVNFLATHPNCHRQEGWQFQWGPSDAPNLDNNIAEAPSPWTTTSVTGVDGTVSFSIPAVADNTWFREVTQSGYVPFSGWIKDGESTPTTQDQISAEMYCGTDVLNYDNLDWVSGASAGSTYYCVAFNAPVAPSCTENQIVVNNQCQSCGENQHVVENQCVDNTPSCTANQILVENSCVSCAENQHVADNQCVDNTSSPSCGTNEILVGNSCVSCGDTQHAVGGNNCVANVPDTSTPTPSGNGGGNGGGGNGPIAGSYGGGGAAPVGPTGQVLGASTSADEVMCSDVLLTKYMRKNSKKNDPDQVKILQQFLNTEMNSNLPINGSFGKLTEDAVKAFQVKYSTPVLNPWGISDPTGFVYKTTLRQINLLHCASLNIPMPTDLTPYTGE